MPFAPRVNYNVYSLQQKGQIRTKATVVQNCLADGLGWIKAATSPWNGSGRVFIQSLFSSNRYRHPVACRGLWIRFKPLIYSQDTFSG